MGSFEPTPEQRRAMEDRGGSLLVSAAAGSGKTKVLVERLFGYMERERCRIDDFLIITFTKAAAAELRGRIAAELSQRVARQPENMHLRRQMMRVYQADIKTVDAFCGSLLRENIHLLPPEGQRSLTPDFRVLDQQEAELLRMQVLEQVLEEFYQRIGRGDTQAQQLAETLGAGRDDRALERLVLDIHGKIQSHAYPMRWLERLREQWQQVPESVGSYREVLTDSILRRTRFWARKLTETAAWMEQYPDLYRGYGDRFLEMAEQLQGYETAAQEGWDAMARLKPAFRRMGVVKGCDGAKEQAQAVRKRCKDELDEIGALLAVSESEQLEDLEAMAPAMLALVQLTEDFTAAYQAEKVRRNCMDFSDQEHYAIRLLQGDDGAPTPLGRQLSGRYREIMVDEYQDTNEVQNCIFRAISRDGQNLFTVGDVKQSIYRFRLADPTIFLEKYLAYRPAEEAEEGQPRKVLLSQNFRSRRQVLSAANFVFGSIMSRQMGEMDYGPEEQLNYGATGYPERHGYGIPSDQRGGQRGGTLRPDGGGGPVRGPSHPAAAGRGLPRAGGGRAAAACPTGGYRDPDALSGGKAEGLHGGPAAGGYPLRRRGGAVLLRDHGDRRDGVVFADRGQSTAGCAAAGGAAVAAAGLFTGSAGPDPGRASGGRLLRRSVCRRRRG